MRVAHVVAREGSWFGARLLVSSLESVAAAVERIVLVDHGCSAQGREMYARSLAGLQAELGVDHVVVHSDSTDPARLRDLCLRQGRPGDLVLALDPGDVHEAESLRAVFAQMERIPFISRVVVRALRHVGHPGRCQPGDAAPLFRQARTARGSASPLRVDQPAGLVVRAPYRFHQLGACRPRAELLADWIRQETRAGLGGPLFYDLSSTDAVDPDRDLLGWLRPERTRPFTGRLPRPAAWLADGTLERRGLRFGETGLLGSDHDPLAELVRPQGQAPAPVPPGSPAVAAADPPSWVTAVAVMAYNRPAYLERCLASVLAHRPARVPGQPAGHTGWHPLPVLVSQDGDDPDVRAIALGAHARRPDSVFCLQHPHELLFGGAGVEPDPRAWPYYHIAAHYRRALTALFDRLGYERVIVVEDDLEVAPDFFDYLLAMAPTLDGDPSLLAVSAWNDHGKPALARDREAVYRTDFFPGLGWMLTRRTWRELRARWPLTHWDDGLRRIARRQGRASIRPEVSRAVTFGRSGTSGGALFDEHLCHVRLNDRPVRFRGRHARGLADGAGYERRFRALVAAAQPVSAAELASESPLPIPGDEDARAPLSPRPGVDVRLEYGDRSEYVLACRTFGLLDEVREGVPRASYLGVVIFRWGRRRVFLAPRGLAPSRETARTAPPPAQ